MSLHDNNGLHACRRTAFVAALLAAGFTIADPASALGAAPAVTNCDDDSSNAGHGPAGSLRSAVANADPNIDTIDMSQLSCSVITLTAGPIHIAQNTLTINGPGMDKLTIHGYYDRVLFHDNTGALYVNDLSMADGVATTYSGTASGGCIYSKATVVLKHVRAETCNTAVLGDGVGTAEGGAIFALAGLDIRYSILTGNNAYASTDPTSKSFGGAAATNAGLSTKYSTFSNNYARYGGGLFGRAGASITSSTISGNTAGETGGGIEVFAANSSGKTTSILNSTISGNSSADINGGVFANSATINIRNSTIAFNTAPHGSIGTKPVAPGLALNAANGNITLSLQSSLIANNTFGSTDYDLSVLTSGHVVTINGYNDLVRNTAAVMPDGTKNSCPLLGPLRDNGGPTQTHALLSHSPAIDTGTNAVNKAQDQRGLGTDVGPPYAYSRISGAAADIGAYEVQQNDIIFNTAFGDCST
jgi:hypothetical protein